MDSIYGPSSTWRQNNSRKGLPPGQMLHLPGPQFQDFSIQPYTSPLLPAPGSVALSFLGQLSHSKILSLSLNLEAFSRLLSFLNLISLLQ
jgi:hypothetical protein